MKWLPGSQIVSYVSDREEEIIPSAKVQASSSRDIACVGVPKQSLRRVPFSSSILWRTFFWTFVSQRNLANFGTRGPSRKEIEKKIMFNLHAAWRSLVSRSKSSWNCSMQVMRLLQSSLAATPARRNKMYRAVSHWSMPCLDARVRFFSQGLLTCMHVFDFPARLSCVKRCTLNSKFSLSEHFFFSN